MISLRRFLWKQVTVGVKKQEGGGEKCTYDMGIESETDFVGFVVFGRVFQHVEVKT